MRSVLCFSSEPSTLLQPIVFSIDFCFAWSYICLLFRARTAGSRRERSLREPRRGCGNLREPRRVWGELGPRHGNCWAPDHEVLTGGLAIAARGTLVKVATTGRNDGVVYTGSNALPVRNLVGKVTGMVLACHRRGQCPCGQPVGGKAGGALPYAFLVRGGRAPGSLYLGGATPSTPTWAGRATCVDATKWMSVAAVVHVVTSCY